MSGKILYIEDNHMNMRLVSVILRRTDYTFVGAESGPVGIKKAQEENPDLILLDINMPGMDGIEVCERLRNIPELTEIPIIALTAWATEEERETYLQKGFDDFLPKPVNRFELMHKIDERIGHHDEPAPEP